MASQCPRCRKNLDDDSVCCATLRYSWKCRGCGKLSTGFVVPYGKCYLCGGAIDVVEAYEAKEVASMKAIEEAVQFELNAYHFYRIGWNRATDPKVKAVFEQMYLNEQDHLAELEKKYHVHLEREILNLPPDVDRLLSNDLFRGVDFDDATGQVEKLYEIAIGMEKRTRDHFRKRAKSLPEGPEKEIYRELAAEEEEHVAMLETELAQFKK